MEAVERLLGGLADLHGDGLLAAGLAARAGVAAGAGLLRRWREGGAGEEVQDGGGDEVWRLGYGPVPGSRCDQEFGAGRSSAAMASLEAGVLTLSSLPVRSRTLDRMAVRSGLVGGGQGFAGLGVGFRVLAEEQFADEGPRPAGSRSLPGRRWRRWRRCRPRRPCPAPAPGRRVPGWRPSRPGPVRGPGRAGRLPGPGPGGSMPAAGRRGFPSSGRRGGPVPEAVRDSMTRASSAARDSRVSSPGQG